MTKALPIRYPAYRYTIVARMPVTGREYVTVVDGTTLKALKRRGRLVRIIRKKLFDG